MTLRLHFAIALAAVAGFCLAGGAIAEDELVEMVAGLLGDADPDIRALAYEQVRAAAPGEAATRRFAALLADLSPAAQIGLLGALTQRGDQVAARDVRALLDGADRQDVRVAAIEAIGGLGDATDVPSLVDYLAGDEDDEQAAARRSLAALAGEEASTAMVAALHRRPAAVQAALLEILAARRARSVIPAILDAAVDDDPVVRRAAMAALGTLAGPQHVPEMLQGVLKAERGRERDAAEKAVMFVCHRAADTDVETGSLLKAFAAASESDRQKLLPTVGRVGGSAALEVVEQALGDSDPETRVAALRALCNWPNASVADRLIELAEEEAHPAHRRMALRSLIRVAPLPDERTHQTRLELLKTAMEMCEQDADRLSVLERAKAVRSVETLRFVLPYLQQPAFAEQAALTIVELAHHSGLREAHRREFHEALDQVIETSDDEVVVDRAKRYKTGQTWVRPKAPR